MSTLPSSFHPTAYDPESIAAHFVADGRSLSYGELTTQSGRIANWLWEHGLRPGDHVATVVSGGPELLQIHWACLRSGLYHTVVNDRLAVDEAAYIIEHCDARVLFVSPDAVSDVGAFVEATAGVGVRVWTSEVGAPLSGDGDVSFAGMLAAMDSVIDRPEPLGRTMLYSSGSTGRPKGVKRPLASGSLADGPDLAHALRATFGIGPGSVYLSTAPLHHAASLGYVEATIGDGATVIIMDRFDPEAMLSLVQKHGVSLVQLVPTMMVRLLRLEKEVRERYDLSSLQVVMHGAGPCTVEVKRAFIDWMGPIVYEYYGGTEEVGHTLITSAEWLEHVGSVGRPVDGYTVHICGDDGHDLPAGKTGVVYFEDCSGRAAEFSYHKAGSESQAHHPFRPSLTTLGDVGHVDEDGYLYLTDRLSDMVVRGGVNVYPREVENILVQHALVADVAVFGVPHDDLGEDVVAVVELIESVTDREQLQQDLRDFVRSRIAHYKCPSTIHFDRLPRAENGKLAKRKLREGFLATR